VAVRDRNALLLEVIAIQSEIAATGLDLDAVMESVVRRAKDLTDADAAVIELAEGDDMVYKAAAGTATSHLGVHLKIDSSLSGLCVRTGEILRSDDTTNDPRVDREVVRRVGAMSMICVPLLHQQTPVGVLKVYSARTHNFDDQDVELLEMLSGLISAHMAHASQFEVSEHERLHDSLTGLLNRRSYESRLAVETSRANRYGRHLCLCLIDLDGFKHVNDTYGHPAGDGVLSAVAEILRTGRTADDVFRIGGDEFAILMPEITRDGAELAASRLAEKIASAALGHGRITASFGVAGATGGGDAAALHEAADQALYAAKRDAHGRRVAVSNL
jgi:diguanylate cyclase